MIIRDKTDPKIEGIKAALGLSGDVYIDGSRHIESLESHRNLLFSYCCSSAAATIKEAEAERAVFEDELNRRRSVQPELAVDETLMMLAELGVNIND